MQITIIFSEILKNYLHAKNLKYIDQHFSNFELALCHADANQSEIRKLPRDNTFLSSKLRHLKKSELSKSKFTKRNIICHYYSLINLLY